MREAAMRLTFEDLQILETLTRCTISDIYDAMTKFEAEHEREPEPHEIDVPFAYQLKQLREINHQVSGFMADIQSQRRIVVKGRFEDTEAEVQRDVEQMTTLFKILAGDGLVDSWAAVKRVKVAMAELLKEVEQKESAKVKTDG